jgi:hypothetical protein
VMRATSGHAAPATSASTPLVAQGVPSGGGTCGAPRVTTPTVRAATCVEIKILRRVRAESSRRPPRHRRDACSMAWRCRFLTARPSTRRTG